MNSLKVVGILMIVIGFALRHYVNRQRFYRRGAGGLQHYSSYSKAVTTSAFEKVLKFIGLVLMVAGLGYTFFG